MYDFLNVFHIRDRAINYIVVTNYELLIHLLSVQVFALENPDVNVLSYSPGPVDTDMFQTVCETINNPETKERLIHSRQTNTVLTTEQTVNRLLEILKEQKYNAADHVDYFDN